MSRVKSAWYNGGKWACCDRVDENIEYGRNQLDREGEAALIFEAVSESRKCEGGLLEARGIMIMVAAEALFGDNALLRRRSSYGERHEK